MPNIVIVIPTYNPTQLLLDTVQDLNNYLDLSDIQKIIVNDGSTQGISYIQDVAKESTIRIIENKVNMGKGAAIKLAITHVKKTMPEVDFILTVDSDRQHLGKDVLLLLESIKKNGSGLHIGFRKLAKNKTPMRSYIGNAFSKKLFYFLYHIELQDTQSGLRAYPKECFSTLLGLKSHRYEFEMEAVVAAVLKKIKIFETSIETVYLNKNQSSHFRPLVDSFKIIFVVIRTKIIKSKL